MNSKYVFILNNDTTVEKNCIEQLHSFMESNKSVAACQPLLCNMDSPEKIASGGCRVGISGKAWDHACGEPIEIVGRLPYQVIAVTGGAMFARTDVLFHAGMFDETFEMYFEDVDLGLRLRQEGYDLYCVPTAKVYHKCSATIKSINHDLIYYYCERNSYMVMLKNFPRVKVLKGYFFGVPASTIAALYNLTKKRFSYSSYITKAICFGLLKLCVHIPSLLRGDNELCKFESLLDTDVIYPPACKR